MKLNEAKYTRRFNTGEYEFEEYTLSVIADENDDGKELLTELKAEVIAAHTNDPKKKEDKENGKSSSSKHNSKGTKSAAKSNEGADDKSSEDDEATNTEADDSSDSESETSESSEASEGDESSDSEEDTSSSKSSSKSKSAKSEKASGKKFKKSPQHYNRGIEQHKEIFGRVYTTINPDWKKKEETKKQAKSISEELEGEPFLDENGEVVDSFKTRIRKLLK